MKIMRFKEFLAEKLVKTQLFEMAYKRQKAIEKVVGVSDELVNHIIKVTIFPEDINANHWKSEIRSWMELIDDIRIKPSNNKLKFDELYEDLFEGPIEDEEGLVKRIKNMGKHKTIPFIPEDINYSITFKKIQYLYKTLCQDLSEDNYEGFEYYLNMLKD